MSSLRKTTCALSVLALTAAAGLAACSGRGTIPLTSVAAKSKTTNIAFTIRVPAAGAASVARGPKYVSAGTQAISVAVSNGTDTKTVAFNVTPSSLNCTSDSSGVSCTEQFPVLIGSDSFAVVAYDTVLNALGATQGNVLSQGTVYQTITEGVDNSVKVTLYGVPATATVAFPNGMPQQGPSTTMPVTLNVQDADGYTIVGTYQNTVEFPCNYYSSLQYYLSVNVNGGNSPWVSASTDTVALTYHGNGIESTTLQACLVTNESTVLGSVQLTPQPSFSAQTSLDTSLGGATAFADSSGSVVFSEPSKSRFAILDQGATQPLYYPIPSGAQPMRLIPRSGSDMYFTLSDNAIGQYDFTYTKVTEYPLPTADAGLYAIGGQWWYDFSVWFTEHDAGKIGEMGTLSTSYGKITEYSTGNANSAPAGMASGGKGFYFADPGANAIGEVVLSTSGAAPVIQEHPLPTASAQPMEITTPDSNQRSWFTEQAVSKVGRIDSTGHIDEFPSAGVPVAIQYGDGAVFVLTSANIIEQYDIQNGSYKTITPPSSTNGPVVGIDYMQLNDLLLMRGNGTTGALQHYYF